MMVMPFDWIWRMPTALICAWLALASKLKAQIRGVKVLRRMFMPFLSLKFQKTPNPSDHDAG